MSFPKPFSNRRPKRVTVIQVYGDRPVTPESVKSEYVTLGGITFRAKP